MLKAFKIIGMLLLLCLVLVVGFGFYIYKTNPTLQAIVNNDESKLYYFPVKQFDDLSAFNFIEIPLKVEDTVTIYAYDFQPEGNPIANVFLIHGSGGNVSRYQDHIATLTKNGFRVYTVDWRGFGKSNGKPLHSNVLADTQLAFQNFQESIQNDSLKTIMYGMSLGGQLATRITKENEDAIDLLVLDGSIESFQSIAIDMSPAEFLKEKARKNPQDFNQDYMAVEDIQNIQHTPKLIIQSADDQTVLPIRGQHLFENAKDPKYYWETQGEHIMTLIKYPEETVERIKDLI